MMSHLPEHVPETQITEMFKFADKDSDGRISYEEFLVIYQSIPLLKEGSEFKQNFWSFLLFGK